LIVGLLGSSLNIPGGAEFVSLNIIRALKEYGCEVVFLSNEKMKPERIKRYYGKTVNVDEEIVFPEFFHPYDKYGIYITILETSILRLKCDIIIDNLSSTILPSADISYIHFPSFAPKTLMSQVPFIGRLYFLPYFSLLEKVARDIRKTPTKKILFANSEFTAQAIEKELGVRAEVLYPPVSTIYKKGEQDFNRNRRDIVVTISRFSEGKNLEIIPKIAEATNENIQFLIAGGFQSERVVQSIARLTKDLNLTRRVKMLPNVPKTELVEALLNSKVYLHTKESEHFGISTVEAMSAGCTPVVHNSGGSKEFVPSQLRYESIQEAAEIIETAIHDWSPECAKEMISIADGFNEEKFVENFLKLAVPFIEELKG
jgi:glycosyltransferase involved in cell wall biosynthesis